VIGDLTIGASSTYAWELGASAADLVTVTGELDLSAESWTLKLIDAGATSAENDLILFTCGSLAGSSLGICIIDTNEVGHWVFADGGPSLYNDAANNRVLLAGVNAVAEPSTVTLLGLALLGFLVWTSRTRRGGA